MAISVAVVLLFAATTALTQSDGDLFAHIAFGREILTRQAIPDASVLGFAPAAALPLVAPAWGSAAILAMLDRMGGLTMVAAFTAVLAGATHGALASLLKRHRVDSVALLLASMLGVVLVSSHWLARPHAFSLATSALLIILLDRGTWKAAAAIPALFVLWTNLHGGWLFGIIVLSAWTLGTIVEHLLDWPSAAARPWQPPALALALSLPATLANPYVLALHKAVLASLADASIGRVINEYQPPSFRNPSDLVFFVLLALTVLLMVRARRWPPLPWLFVMLLTTAFALRAGRNISLFGVTAWPLLTLHLAPEVSPWLRRFSVSASQGASPNDVRACAPAGRWSAAVFALLLLLGAMGGRVAGATLIDGRVDPRRFPVEAARRLRADSISGSLLTTWTWSGYVPYAWHGRRTFFDPLSFSARTLDSFGTMLLAQPGWRGELDAHAIEWVMVPASVPLGDSLRHDAAWSTWHEDSTALVLHRVAATTGAQQ